MAASQCSDSRWILPALQFEDARGTIGVIAMFEQKQNVPASAPPEVQKLLATRIMWYEASCWPVGVNPR